MAATTKIQKSKNSVNKRRLEKLMRNKLAMFGLFLFLFVIIMCVIAPLLTDSDPNFIDMIHRFEEKSEGHPFGYDQSGRDVWARLLYGGRISIAIGLVCSICTNILGAILGSMSGYFGGWVDQTMIFIREVFNCFPQQMLILIIMGLAGEGIGVMFLVFIGTGWTSTCSMLRAKVLSLKQETFVESCRANGISSASIMFRHLIPNAMGPFIINITSNVAGYVLSEASLSFLGLGVPKGIVTWGNMLNAARNLVTMQNYPTLWVLPGIAISLFVLGVNFFGDGLRDVFDVAEE